MDTDIIHQMTRVQVLHTPYYFLLFSLFSLSYKTPIMYFEWRWQSYFGVSILVTTVLEHQHGGRDVMWKSYWHTKLKSNIPIFIYLFWVQDSIMNMGHRDIFYMDRFSILSNILLVQGTKSSYFLFRKIWGHMRYPCYMVTICNYIISAWAAVGWIIRAKKQRKFWNKNVEYWFW